MAKPALPFAGRLILSGGILALAALFIFLPWSGWVQRDHQWQQQLAMQSEIQRLAVLQSQQALKRQASMAAHSLANNSDSLRLIRRIAVLAASKGLDDPDLIRLRAQLHADLSAFWQVLEQAGANQLHIHLSPGVISLLRMHRPENWGDPLEDIRPLVAEVQRSGTAMNGMEIGRYGSGMRGVVPIRASDADASPVIATLEVGFGMLPELRQLDAELGAGLALLLHRPSLEGIIFDHQSSGLVTLEQGDWLLDNHSRPQVLEWLQAGLLPTAVEQATHQIMDSHGQQFLLTRVPVRDVTAEADPARTPLAEILVWRDISTAAAEHRHLQWLLLGRWLLAFGATLLLLGVLLVIFRRAAQRQALLQAHVENEREALLARFDKLTYHLPGVVYQYQLAANGHDCFPYTSHGITELYGVTPAMVAEDAGHLVQRMHPDDAHRVQNELAHSARTLDIWRSEYRISHPRLGERWVAGFASPEGLANGDTVWYGFITDVTEERRRNEEIRQARSFLRAVIDASTEVAVITTDPQGLITLFNSGAEKLLGYSADEVVGRHSPELFHLPSEIDNRAALLEQQRGHPVTGMETLLARARDGHSETLHWTYVRKDGRQRLVNLTVTRIADHDNQLIGFLGVATDISEVILATRALQKSESHFRSMVSNLPGAVYHCQNDAHWTMSYLSDEIVSITGYPASELINSKVRSYASIIHPDDLHITYATIEKIERRESFEITYRILHADGHAVWVREKGRGEYSADGQLLWLSGFIWDATEQQRIDQMKSQFVSTVSHELRTPLTAIAGSLALINSGVLGAVPASMHKLLHIAHDNSNQLNALINDLLDMDRLAAGKMRFNMQKHALAPILFKAIDNNRSYAEQFGVSLEVRQLDPVLVNVDALRLEQILANYLSNAAKFSHAGQSVALDAVREGDKVRISVTDSGVGIPSDCYHTLFQKFSQVDATDTRQRGGTGLGLAICRELAENMHGEVGFSSRPGEGSCFWCLFDAEPLEDEPR